MSLLGMPREHWDALEADLMRAGFTLADYPARYGLRTLRAFVYHAQRDSSYAREVRGEKSEWHYTQELLARVLEALQDANWQRAGNKSAPRPKPLPRPGDKPDPSTQHFGDEPLTIAEFEKRMRERIAA